MMPYKGISVQKYKFEGSKAFQMQVAPLF